MNTHTHTVTGHIDRDTTTYICSAISIMCMLHGPSCFDSRATSRVCTPLAVRLIADLSSHLAPKPVALLVCLRVVRMSPTLANRMACTPHLHMRSQGPLLPSVHGIVDHTIRPESRTMLPTAMESKPAKYTALMPHLSRPPVSHGCQRDSVPTWAIAACMRL